MRDIKRAFVISDLHFGVHSSKEEWLEIQKDYFYNFFIPLLEREKRDGDALFILGDVFENRQTVNILVMNEVIKLFKKLSKMLPIVILIGNHDCYKKSTTDTHSSIMFESIDNIDIVDTMKEMEASGKKLLFVPWVEDKKEMQEILKSNSANYLFVHDDFSGMKSNSKTVVPGGLPYAIVKNYDFVYSGHIHFGQKINNVTMVGTPYHTEYSDVDNIKKVYLLDFTDTSEKTFDNYYSPMYKRVKLEDAIEMGEEKFKEEVNNNFVEVIVDSSKTKSFDCDEFASKFSESRSIEFKPTASEVEEDEESYVEDAGKSNEELIEDWVAKTDYDARIKTKLVEVAKKVLRKAQEI